MAFSTMEAIHEMYLSELIRIYLNRSPPIEEQERRAQATSSAPTAANAATAQTVPNVGVTLTYLNRSPPIEEQERRAQSTSSAPTAASTATAQTVPSMGVSLTVQIATPVEQQQSVQSPSPAPAAAPGPAPAAAPGAAPAAAPGPAPAPADVYNRRGLSLTREQMLEAQGIFRKANCVKRSEKALILAFMAGSKVHPCPDRGNIIGIKLSEKMENVLQPDDTFLTMSAEVHFQMNYNNGTWKIVHFYRYIDGMVPQRGSLRSTVIRRMVNNQ